jgi:hypothetical protein
LILSKPEKRWVTLHHTHKLDIIAWIIDLVAQTGVIRDFMEESTTALTEVRKEQVDVKREWKKMQAELAALEPKKEVNGEGDAEVDGDGDVPMKAERSITPSIPALASDRDELEETPPPSDDENQVTSPLSSDPLHTIVAGAARRQAMASKAAERAEEEALRLQRAKAERETIKAKKNESKALSAEKKRLIEEEERLTNRLRELELDFRTHIYTLRSRPIGVDRFGNKVWWMDGIGSGVPLSSSYSVEKGYGTGRLYLQGVEEEDEEYMIGVADCSREEVKDRRKKEEGDGLLGPGEWGVYDTPEQVRLLSSS